MAEMKTLTVNGKTYTVADPDAAHINDEVVGDSAWSSKNIVDMLCPGFAASGAAVRCAPVEGYPLQVTTALPESAEGYTRIELRQLGKNLYDKDSYPLANDYVQWGSGDLVSPSKDFKATGFIPVPGLQGKDITLNHCPNDKSPNTRAGMAFYEYDAAEKKYFYISGTNLATFTVPENATHMRFSVPNEYTAEDIQIEVGSEITGYEPYRSGVTVVAELTEPAFGSYQWPPLAALPGTNTIYSNVGDTSVTGRADLIAHMDKLQQTVADQAEQIAALQATNAALLEG